MNSKIGNPGVVGLAGFGMTALLLQFHTLGLTGLGPVIAMGFIFDGQAQFIAGFMEQKTGKNFGIPQVNVFAGYVLIMCALSAWYMMAAVILNDISGKPLLKLGDPIL